MTKSGSGRSARQCQSLNAAGTLCRQPPLIDDSQCFWHSPNTEDQRKKAWKLGGQRRKREHVIESTYDLTGLESVSGLRRLLEIVTADTLHLDNSNQRSRTIIAIAREARELLKVSEIEDRISQLEDLLSGRSAQ